MDASKKGLGACLIQKGKVVCYASRAVTEIEQNYQNLKREASGTIWGMEKFHYFLYGKEFTLETDQKPLVYIYVYSRSAYMYHFTAVLRLQYEVVHADVRSSLSRTMLYSNGVVTPADID